MSADELADQLTQAARRMLDAGHASFVDGDDVARAIGRDPADPALHQAFRTIQARGALTLRAWGGGPGLPHEVGGPRMN